MIVYLLCPLNSVFILLIKKHLILWLGTLKIYKTFLLLDNLFSFDQSLLLAYTSVHSVLLQRDRFVCCLESRGHYSLAKAEAASTLDALCCALSQAAFAKPCHSAASVAPLLPKGKVKEGACVVLLQLAARIVVSNLHKNAKKSFSEMIKDMYLHYNGRSGLLLCGFQT
ncbi:hypothetical protein CFC21_058861 [Triticum aestivum]|uniref:Separase-like TPR repeats region domain-containing protein n=2 Tax=Triticum aestivum TaxID=4565 RepID=A0A9R1KDW0_WHEAT|nr:uncharacterized protein LOC123093341 isoform X1 [Triticum aestivum]XP_044371213.1 uncharacterized protein LOC123093341 isoform X1 [Triticum aestivum]KAF7050499.1 hypothetical protein CFC21_058861 [Triticum aestivum]